MPATDLTTTHRLLRTAAGAALLVLTAAGCAIGPSQEETSQLAEAAAASHAPDAMPSPAGTTDAEPTQPSAREPTVDGRAGIDSTSVEPHVQVIDGQIIVPDRTDATVIVDVRTPASIDVGNVEVAIIEVDERSRPQPPPTPTPVPSVKPTTATSRQPTSTPVPPPDTCDILVRVPTEVLQFGHDSAIVEPGGLAFLDNLATELSGVIWIRVVGHASSDGNDAHNMTLSLARAEAVASVLRDLTHPDTRILAERRGELEPVADNGTAEGRARNRRVELTAEVPQATCNQLERQ